MQGLFRFLERFFFFLFPQKTYRMTWMAIFKISVFVIEFIYQDIVCNIYCCIDRCRENENSLNIYMKSLYDKQTLFERR